MCMSSIWSGPSVILFIREMYGNKYKSFSWSGAFSVVGQGCYPTISFYLALVRHKMFCFINKAWPIDKNKNYSERKFL